MCWPHCIFDPPWSVTLQKPQKIVHHEAVKVELDGHKTTGTYEAAAPPRGRKPVGAKWVFSYKTDKDGLIVKTKARFVAEGSNQVQDVDYFQTFAPTPSSASFKIMAAVQMNTTVFVEPKPGCPDRHAVWWVYL